MSDDNIIKFGEFMKMFGGMFVGAIAVTITIVFWIQSQGNERYYPKLAGENLEKQISKIEQHMDTVERQNVEIIKILSNINESQKK